MEAVKSIKNVAAPNYDLEKTIVRIEQTHFKAPPQDGVRQLGGYSYVEDNRYRVNFTPVKLFHRSHQVMDSGFRQSNARWDFLHDHQ